MEFDGAVIAVLESQGCKARTPDVLLEWWSNFVDQCVEGYDWTIYEFDDELAVRDYIELMLSDISLTKYAEFAVFVDRVALLDAKYRAILQAEVKRPSDSNNWWRTGVLKYAGAEYCEDMLSRYRIKVDEYDDD